MTRVRKHLRLFLVVTLSFMQYRDGVSSAQSAEPKSHLSGSELYPGVVI